MNAGSESMLTQQFSESPHQQMQAVSPHRGKQLIELKYLP